MKCSWPDFSDRIDAMEFSNTIDFVCRKILPLLTLSGIAGVAVGLVVSLFNLLLDKVSHYSRTLAVLVSSNLEYSPLFILGICLIGFLVYQLTKILPEAKGSGIPRTEAMLIGKKRWIWWKVSLATIVGSTLSFSAGMSLGAEGPSVQLGAGVANGIEKLGGKKGWKNYVSNAGAAAGFASAFGAPFTGIMFVQEEVQRKFNPLMIASSVTAVAYSSMIYSLISNAVGTKSMFFAVAKTLFLPNNYLWLAIVIGVVVAIAAYLFNTAILSISKHSKKSKLPMWLPLIFAFLVTALLDLFFINSMGSGLFVVRNLLNENYDLKMVLILSAVKVALVLMCFRSGATGGIMVPMLTIGALVGGLLGFALVAAGVPAQFFVTIVLISMCSFFGASISAPLTVILLFLETTGGFDALPAMVLSIFVAMIVSKLLKSKPLYDTLAESEFDNNMLHSCF